MRFTAPTITDHGSIAEHTFYRCPGGNPSAPMPKDHQVFGHDKFGECSSGHGGGLS